MKLLPKGYGFPLSFCIQSMMPSLSVTTMPDKRSTHSVLSAGHMGTLGPIIMVFAFSDSSTSRGMVLFTAALPVMLLRVR